MTLAPARQPDFDVDTLAPALADVREVGPVTFLIDGEPLTYRATDDDVVESQTSDGKTVVALSKTAWDDLVAQVRTPIALLLGDELTFEQGGFNGLSAWDRALRYLHSGMPPYSPARADLNGRDPLSAHTLDESDAELRTQLETIGFVHLKGVFSAEEMAAANAEVDRLAAASAPGDDLSWHVDTDDGERLCRLIYASERSEPLKAIEQDPRIARLGRLLSENHAVYPDRMEGSAVLIKVPGKTQGLSNIPWHQDCGIGGHSVYCPALIIGIQLTGSTPETGNLLAVPGSHGQTLPGQWDKDTGVPVVEINTEPGDVTLHISDVMHASPEPTAQGGRRTMYVSFYPRTLPHYVGSGEGYNDLVRNRQRDFPPE